MMLKDYKQIEGTIGILKGVLEQLVNCFLELLGGKKLLLGIYLWFYPILMSFCILGCAATARQLLPEGIRRKLF